MHVFEIQQSKRLHRREALHSPGAGGCSHCPLHRTNTSSISSECPCTLQEDVLPAQEPATPFKQQRGCLADVKVIMHPLKEITEQNAPDICQQTEAQPSPDSLISRHSHISTGTHHHFSVNQMTSNLSFYALL